MPKIVKYTDEKCVEKNRTILFVDFDYSIFNDEDKLKDKTPLIKETLDWFEENNIEYEQIGPFSNSGFLCGYYGRYYIDVPYETSNEKYKLLEEYFENPDGSMKDERKLFCYTKVEWRKEILDKSKALWEDEEYMV